MHYPLWRLLKAVKGDEGELIELSLLIQHEDFNDQTISEALFEHAQSNPKNLNSRYLYAWYIKNGGAHSKKCDAQSYNADKELEILASEGHLLATNAIHLNKNESVPLPTLLLNAKNPLIRANIAERRYPGMKRIYEWIDIAKNLDIVDNRNLRRLLIRKIINFAQNSKNAEYYKPSAADIKTVRNFFTSAQYFAELKTLMPDTVFTESELTAFFDRVNKLHGFIAVLADSLKPEQLGNRTLNDIEEAMYQLQILFRAKESYYLRQIEAMTGDCDKLAESNAKFKKAWGSTKSNLESLFSTAEDCYRSLSAKMRNITEQQKALSKLKKEVEDEANVLIKHNADIAQTATASIKELKRQNANLSARNEIQSQENSAQATTMLNGYHSLVASLRSMQNNVSESFKETFSLVDISDISKQSFTSLNPKQMNEFVIAWNSLLKQLRNDTHPLHAQYGLYNTAWELIKQSVNLYFKDRLASIRSDLKKQCSLNDTWMMTFSDRETDSTTKKGIACIQEITKSDFSMTSLLAIQDQLTSLSKQLQSSGDKGKFVSDRLTEVGVLVKTLITLTQADEIRSHLTKAP